MDIVAILALIAKGVSIAETLIAAGQSAGPAIEVIKNLVTGAQTGKVTQDTLDKNEAVLDALIEDFNEPIPE